MSKKADKRKKRLKQKMRKKAQEASKPSLADAVDLPNPVLKDLAAPWQQFYRLIIKEMQ